MNKFIENLMRASEFEIKHAKKVVIGDYVCRERKERGLTIKEVSELTGIRMEDIHKIEYGNKMNTTPFHLKRIAKVLNINYMELYKMAGYLD